VGLYDDIGGMAGCRRLAESFYARLPGDPVLAPLFSGSLRCAVDGFTLYLAQFLGGPAEYSEHRWHLSLRDAHARFRIGAKERDAWLRNMRRTLHETEMPADLRKGLLAFFEQSASWIIGQPEIVQCPHAELARGWHAQHTLEQAIAAIHKGDPRQAIDWAENSAGDLPSLASLLALILDTDYCAGRLRRQPELAQVRHARARTLLHDAAAAGSVAIVRLLLELGADPNALDGGGHSPLYSLANQCRSDSGAAVVPVLVEGGADVHAQMGVQRCTALHMAARRGSVAIAAALLECGASRDVRDRKGDTPWMRAVNCRKMEVAALLAG